MGGLLPFVKETVKLCQLSEHVFLLHAKINKKCIISICVGNKREQGRRSSLYGILSCVDFLSSL